MSSGDNNENVYLYLCDDQNSQDESSEFNNGFI